MTVEGVRMKEGCLESDVGTQLNVETDNFPNITEKYSYNKDIG